MDHRTIVSDSDKFFEIDPITRSIKPLHQKTTIIQFDHNSERFIFSIPRIIEGHDMSTCTKVEVHYVNVDADTKEEVPGLYTVDDLGINPKNDTNVTCTWLISQNATQKAGLLKFLVRFVCVNSDNVIEYAWNTGIYQSISIAPGIYNSETIIKQYADVIEQWKASIAKDFQLKEYVIEGYMSFDEDGNLINATVNKRFSEIMEAYQTGHFPAMKCTVEGFDEIFYLRLYSAYDTVMTFTAVDTLNNVVSVIISSDDKLRAKITPMTKLIDAELSEHRVQTISDDSSDKDSTNYPAVVAVRNYVKNKIHSIAGTYVANDLVGGITAEFNPQLIYPIKTDAYAIFIDGNEFAKANYGETLKVASEVLKATNVAIVFYNGENQVLSALPSASEASRGLLLFNTI